MNFVRGTLADGRRLRPLNIVDMNTGECRAIEVDTSPSGGCVVGVLERLCEEHRAPEWIMTDNAPVFTSNALDVWDYSQKVVLEFIRPGKPMENG